MSEENKTKTAYSKEKINGILGLRGSNGQIINVFKLYGILFIGNCIDGQWDLTTDGQFKLTGISHIPIRIEDFEGCESEDDMRDQFVVSLRLAMKESS